VVTGTEGLPSRAAMQWLVTASWISHAVRTMAVLGLADHLAAGPRTVDELAATTGAHGPTLGRFLRTIAGLGLCATAEDGRVRLTPLGELLRADAPDSMRPYALAITSPAFQRAWDELPEAVRAGEATFPRANGVGFWEYMTAHPDEGALFDGAMTGAAVARGEALLTARDLSSVGKLVDVGGGQGRLLATALGAVPGLRGLLFDRPAVLGGAEAVLRAAGVADRCELVGGDFFAAVPTGGDAYVLGQILHDWPDAEALEILRVCHRAMAPGARLWIVELTIQPGDGFDRAKLLDLNMLVLFGAKERTAAEYRTLLEAAGFGDVAVLPTGTPWTVVEAVRP
jgi:hypothetical protein